MINNCKWISAGVKEVGECPVFYKEFEITKDSKVFLDITAKGVYYAELNGKRVGDFIMAPGYTQYSSRLQYQTYDITDLIVKGKNILIVTVSAGWWAGRRGIGFFKNPWNVQMIAEISIENSQGEKSYLSTDESWSVCDGQMCFSDIYDGEVYDASKTLSNFSSVEAIENVEDILIPQEGEKVVEHERFLARRIITTPKGETVIDFGQNMAGYPEFSLVAKQGEVVEISFAEILDKDGNFYNENYRTAKCTYRYICKDGFNTYKPRCTFYGFRYIRIDKFPTSAILNVDTFTAVAVYSDLKQTGEVKTGNAKLNRLISNAFWGQRSNFFDIPMDCPQRDEKLGWTGDAQVFCKTSAYNYDVLKFFRKWLRDMKAAVREFGNVGFKVPCSVAEDTRAAKMAAGWADAATIIPWQIYLTYGDKSILEEFLEVMVSHVETIRKDSEEAYTWRGGEKLHQFGDWLATDALDKDREALFIEDTYSGATDPNFLQAAFYAYSLDLVIRASEILNIDASNYKVLREKVVEKFHQDFPVCKTQTECIIALKFGLALDRDATAKLLVRMIHENGDRMSTGFIGTPYILHVLSDIGRTDLAYSLLLSNRFPSWLYCVELGATTMWEHWDGINKEGELWNKEMNSFNHYAYGAFLDWIYEVAAGIGQESGAGFAHPVISPHPDKRLGSLDVRFKSPQGKIVSKWFYEKNEIIRYEITVPVKSKIIINGKGYIVEKGSYIFY